MSLGSAKATAVLLIISALLGIYILVEDAALGPKGGRFLWELNKVASPIPHAYGLIVFVIIDLVLAGLVLSKFGPSVKLAFVWGVLQFLAMALDPLSAGPYYSGIPYQQAVTEFAKYLFGLWAFDLRLIVQILIAAFAFRARSAVAQAPIT